MSQPKPIVPGDFRMTSATHAHDRGGDEIMGHDGHRSGVTSCLSPPRTLALPECHTAILQPSTWQARRPAERAAMRPACLAHAARPDRQTAAAGLHPRSSAPAARRRPQPAPSYRRGEWLEAAWIGLLRPACPEHRMHWRCWRWSARERDRVRFLGWSAGGDGAVGIDSRSPRGPKPKRGLHGPRFRIQAVKSGRCTPDPGSKTNAACPPIPCRTRNGGRDPVTLLSGDEGAAVRRPRRSLRRVS